MSELLKVENLSIGYQKVLQKDLAFSVHEGSVLVIKGRNGSGKSTLIKTLNGDKRPLKGNVKWKLHRKSITTLPQLVSHEFPLSITLGEILDTFELTEETKSHLPANLRDRLFNDASGGEKQKTLILSRIQEGIDFLILDEPFNHMDKAAISEILDFLCELIDKKLLKALAIISHVSVDIKLPQVVEVELI